MAQMCLYCCLPAKFCSLFSINSILILCCSGEGDSFRRSASSRTWYEYLQAQEYSFTTVPPIQGKASMNSRKRPSWIVPTYHLGGSLLQSICRQSFHLVSLLSDSLLQACCLISTARMSLSSFSPCEEYLPVKDCFMGMHCAGKYYTATNKACS